MDVFIVSLNIDHVYVHNYRANFFSTKWTLFFPLPKMWMKLYGLLQEAYLTFQWKGMDLWKIMPFSINLSKDQMKIQMTTRKRGQWFLQFTTFTEHDNRSESDEACCKFSCENKGLVIFCLSTNQMFKKNWKFLTCILQLRLFCYCGASFLPAVFFIRKGKRQMRVLAATTHWNTVRAKCLPCVWLIFRCILTYHLNSCGDFDSFIFKNWKAYNGEIF